MNYPFVFFQTWYMSQTRMINEWLNERKNHSLHPYQFTCLSTIMKVGSYYSLLCWHHRCFDSIVVAFSKSILDLLKNNNFI